MNKSKIIVFGIIGVILLIILSFIIINLNKEKVTQQEDVEISDFSEVFEIQDIEKSKYKVEKNNEVEISEQYITGLDMYTLKGSVQFVEKEGIMIYVRESSNDLNIYQTEYKIDEYENISSQVEQIIEDFDMNCKSYLGVEYDEDGTEELRGESNSKGKIPLGESIYYENRCYIKTYEVEGKHYEVNFYRKDNKIICEFVNELESL